MLLLAKKDTHYEFQVWVYTIIDLASERYGYVYSETLRGTVGAGSNQTYLFTSEALPFGAAIRGVTSDHGEKVFVVNEVEYDMYVNSSEPTFDIYDRVTGYRQALRRTAPTTPVGGSH